MSVRLANGTARWLVRHYPARWRARYAAEMLDLLERRPPTWAGAWNLACHLLYAHLHPDLALTGDESAVERLVALMRALRSSEIVVFYAFVAAMVAWLQFGGLVDGGPYMPLTGSAGSWPGIGLHPANGISAGLALQSAAVDLAFVALAAGGVPLVLAAWRRAPALRWYLLVPLAAVILAVLPAPLGYLLRGAVPTLNLTFESPVTIAYCVWFVVLAAVSAAALGRVIAGGTPGDGLVRCAFVPSALVTLALVLLLAATIFWGVAAHQEYPQLFDQATITSGHMTTASWLLDVEAMAGAALVAVLATIRGRIGGAVATAAADRA
jgi:hypothetical protein